MVLVFSCSEIYILGHISTTLAVYVYWYELCAFAYVSHDLKHYVNLIPGRNPTGEGIRLDKITDVVLLKP